MLSIDKIQKVPPPTRRLPHNVCLSAALCEWSGLGAALLWKLQTVEALQRKRPQNVHLP